MDKLQIFISREVQSSSNESN